MTLQSLGWTAFFEAHLQNNAWRPCRVVSEATDLFLVHDGEREVFAVPRGRLRNHPDFPPVVGDWVLVKCADDRYVVESILPRRSAIVRKQPASRASVQVLAANVDRVLLVTSMNQDFSVRRLERYLTLVWESGASPVIVLTKADLVSDSDLFRREAKKCALGFPVLCVSSVTGDGIGELRSLLVAGETLVLLGSSGVGKSTLVNVLGGADMRETRSVREKDGKGRHATTDRHLMRLPSGALMIDTPGLREVQLWASDMAVAQTFPEISALAIHCRFRDCQHQGEPGCAVAAGIAAGQIDVERLHSLRHLRLELDYLDRRSDPLSAMQHKSKIKRMTRAQEQQQRRRKKP
ncbi:MAG TPA: ribosome small subunit-dependent GTPase A [Candidatus Acidoferrales bacterium]|nr:ribosome small subunit-dependent GTPase A [Candidatus Acidoferrales bacterium]